MPTQKHLQENVEDEDLPENNGGIYQEDEEESEDEDEMEPHLQDEDSDRSYSSDEGQKPEFVTIPLTDLRKEVQCPICLGIIRKTRTVMECMHRFCRVCIDKSMRMGNKECPACRTHCASRRSLRDDPNYDALIAVLYPNVDQFEEEELAFHEEEDARNKQIQDLIAQTFRRQSEAASKKRKRSQNTTRRRASYRSDDNDDANGNYSSADDRRETRPKRTRRFKGQSPGVGGGYNENDPEVNRDNAFASTGLVGNSEILAWGRGGMRSHTRCGTSGGGGSGKQARNNRLARLSEHLRNLDESQEMDIQILLVSVDVEKMPNLQQPYLCCSPTLHVGQICQFIAFQTSSQVDEIELLAVKELHSNLSSLTSFDVQPSESLLLDPCKDELQLLHSEQTVQEVKSTFNLQQGHLILAYRHKLANTGACNEANSSHVSSSS